MAGMSNGTAPARPNPPALVPAVKRKAAAADRDDDQPDAGDTVFQSRATATPKPKAAKRPRLTEDDGDDKASGGKDDTNMQDAPVPATSKKTFKILLKAGTVAPDHTRKNQLGMAVAYHRYAQSSAAIDNNNEDDVVMQGAPATIATKMVNGPISLEAREAGVKTTGKGIL